MKKEENPRHITSNEVALWTYAATIHLRHLHYLDRDPDAYPDDWSFLRHQYAAILSKMFKNSSWIQGRQDMIEIIGIHPSKLKSATLGRVLCENPCNEAYVQHCLNDEEIDMNWQNGSGFSVLGPAAAYASPKICKIVLNRHNVNVNRKSHYGLRPIHIAVTHGNNGNWTRFPEQP